MLVNHVSRDINTNKHDATQSPHPPLMSRWTTTPTTVILQRQATWKHAERPRATLFQVPPLVKLRDPTDPRHIGYQNPWLKSTAASRSQPVKTSTPMHGRSTRIRSSLQGIATSPGPGRSMQSWRRRKCFLCNPPRRTSRMPNRLTRGRTRRFSRLQHWHHRCDALVFQKWT